MSRRLILAESELTTVPDDIGTRTGLRVLDVAHNRLTTLPPGVADRWNPMPARPTVAAALSDRGCYVLWP